MDLTEQQLLHAVMAEPRDVATRLVYSDWLADRGEVDRATQIRLQCDYADSPDHDYRRIAYRSWIKDHPNAAPLPELPDGLRWSNDAYQRGFPERLEVLDVGAFVTHAGALFDRAPIVALDVDAHAKEVFPLDRLLAVPQLARITRLELRRGHFHAGQIRRLADCEHLGALEELDLSFGGVTEAGLAALVASDLGRRLVRLVLRYDFVVRHGKGLEVFRAAELPRLRHLSLAMNRMGPELVPDIVGNKQLQLERLVLFDNPLSDVGWRSVAESALPLIDLDLGKTQSGLAGLRALVESPLRTSLRALRIANSGFGPRAAVIIASAHWPELEFVDMAWHALTGPGIAALCESTGFPRLQRADLRERALGEPDATSLATRRIKAWYESTARMREVTET